jgi:PPM family protein phosphatase
VTNLQDDAAPLRVQIHGLTDPGRKRKENQDHFLVADLGSTEDSGVLFNPGTDRPGSESLPPLVPGPRGLLLLVADGMGGAAAGSVASKMAARWIFEGILERWEAVEPITLSGFAEVLKLSVEAANQMVHAQAVRYPHYQGMGTTATVAGVLGRTLCLAQVGDSRAYLMREGVASQLTRDQSLVQEMIEAGTLSEAEAEASRFSSVILQAVGGSPEIAVVLSQHAIAPSDVLLLCSDGLSRLVRPEEIAAILGRNADLSAACSQLVDTANERGGPDNITVVVARFEQEAGASSSPVPTSPEATIVHPYIVAP